MGLWVPGCYTRLHHITPFQYLSCLYIVTIPDLVYVTSVFENVLCEAAQILSRKAFYVYMLLFHPTDWAWNYRRNKCWPCQRASELRQVPSGQRPLGDLNFKFSALHWWGSTADAYALGRGFQPGLCGPRRTEQAGGVQLSTALALLGGCDQCSWYHDPI